VTVNYDTANATATAPGDYTQASSQTLDFFIGETTRTITVPVNGDTTDEPDETFKVNLSSPSNATISDGKGIGTITDDDATPPPPDTTAPTGSVSINGGAKQTRKLVVTLNLSASDPAPGSGVAEMRFSNDGRAFGAWEPFAPTKSYTLSKKKAGNKAVHVQFRDGAGNVSATVSDAIKYVPKKRR
jgi:hypothetical protein